MKIEILRLVERTLAGTERIPPTLHVIDVRVTTGWWLWRHSYEEQFLIRGLSEASADSGFLRIRLHIHSLDDLREPAFPIEQRIKEFLELRHTEAQHARILASYKGTEKELWRSPSLMIDEEVGALPGESTVRKGPHR